MHKTSWSCDFQSLNITKLVVEHRGSFSDVPLVPMVPMGAGFVDYVLSIVNAHCAVRVVPSEGAIRRALLEGQCCIHKGKKDNAFSGPQKRAEVLRRAVLNGKKVVQEHGFFKRARRHYMSSPRCSQLFNQESLAQKLCKHTTI